MRTKKSYTRRITVTAIMTIVILVLFECFKVVYNNNNDDDLCVNVCRGSEKNKQRRCRLDRCVRACSRGVLNVTFSDVTFSYWRLLSLFLEISLSHVVARSSYHRARPEPFRIYRRLDQVERTATSLSSWAGRFQTKGPTRIL